MKRLYKETTMAITNVTTPFNADYNIIQLEVVGNLMFYECIKMPYDTLTPIETLHTNHQPKKMTKAELSRYLYDNYYDANDNIIDLTKLDFRQFNCNVDICNMKVSKDLYQGGQWVGNNLWQDLQQVGGDLKQTNQDVNGEIYQDKVGDEI